MLLQRGFFVVGVVLGSMLVANGAGAQGSTFVGQRVGKNNHGEEVRVRREVGSLAGYDDRLQATAMARLAKIEPAIVVKGADAKWHALETTASFFGGGAAADNGALRQVVALPSIAALDATKRDVDALTEKVTKNRADAHASEDLARTNRLYASLVFGVEDKEIAFIARSAEREAKYINLNHSLVPLGTHGPEKPAAAGETYFGLEKKTAIEVRTTQLAVPREAAATLFHEATHRADYELTRKWAARYTAETKRTAKGPQFVQWLLKRDADALPRADAQLVADIADRAHSATEARAHLRTFIAAMQGGAYEVANRELSTYAGEYGAFEPGPYVTGALLAELETAYRQLPAESKKEFDAAFASLKPKHGKTWIAKFDHATALAKR